MVVVGVEQCSDDGPFLQPGNKAKRHQPRLSLHSCKGIRNPDGAVWDSEEKKDDAGLRDSRDRYPATPLGGPCFYSQALLWTVCLCLRP